MTVTVLVLEPFAFVAVNVNAVLEVTLTTFDVPVTAPTPESTETLVALLTSQIKVTNPAPVRLEGVALKALMIGFGVAVAGCTVTVTVLDTLESPADVALICTAVFTVTLGAVYVTLEPVVADKLPPPDTMLQFTPVLNVPVPLTVAVRLEVAAEAMVAGVALASMAVILMLAVLPVWLLNLQHWRAERQA